MPMAAELDLSASSLPGLSRQSIFLKRLIPTAAELDLSASSLPGLTRQSIFLKRLTSFPMDARVKPAHDEAELDAPGTKCNR
jgi:hypothetical protein